MHGLEQAGELLAGQLLATNFGGKKGGAGWPHCKLNDSMLEELRLAGRGVTWKRETESSFAALVKWALMTQLPRLLCHTSRRPLCLLK